jgi:hypothetical protein
MELVKCKDCQCWDKESGFKETKRDDWGICRRKAPNMVYTQPKTAMYVFRIPFIKKVFNLPLYRYNVSFYSEFVGMPETAGCWEGISREIEAMLMENK